MRISIAYDKCTVHEAANFPITAGLYLGAPETLSAGSAAIDLKSTTGATIIDKSFAYVNAADNASAGEYTLLIGGDIEVAGSNSRALIANNARLTIMGIGKMRTISLTSHGRMFDVGAGQDQTNLSLILGNNITLKGWDGNNQSVVCVRNGAVFTMQGNSKITKNKTIFDGGGVNVSSASFIMKDTSSVSGNKAENNGGGVFVDSGSFTMEDNASVSNNIARYGGGVYIMAEESVYSMKGNTAVSKNSAEYGGGINLRRGIFNMQGGIISGNSAVQGGGLDIQQPQAAAYISNGIIYGNNAAGRFANTASNCGAALFIWGNNGTAEHGSYSGGTWTGAAIPTVGSGYYIFRDVTIEV